METVYDAYDPLNPPSNRAGLKVGDFCRYYPGSKKTSRSGQIYYRLLRICVGAVKTCSAPWPEEAEEGRSYGPDEYYIGFVGEQEPLVITVNKSVFAKAAAEAGENRFGCGLHPLNVTDMYCKLTGTTQCLPLLTNNQTVNPETETMFAKTMTRIDRVAALVNTKSTTCAVRHGTGEPLVYRITLPLAEEIQTAMAAEDYAGKGVPVWVTAGGNLKAARVHEVHAADNPQIDPDGDLVYQWVFSHRVPADLRKAMQADKELAESLAQRQRTNMRQAVLAEYGVESAQQLLSNDSSEK